MKKNVWVFGLIAGAIVAVVMNVTVYLYSKTEEAHGSMLLGYATMLVAFSFIFVGIKNYRDKFNNGVISFGQAFKMGLYMSLIASTIYVLAWMVNYYCFMPDFMAKLTAHELKQLQESGASAAAIAEEKSQMEMFARWYKNPLGVIALTYAEILPVGLLVSLITAFILKRRVKDEPLYPGNENSAS